MIETPTEKLIDDLIAKGKNTLEITEVLKSQGLSDEQISSIITEYNSKSVTTSSTKKSFGTISIVAVVLAIALIPSAFFFLNSKNSRLTSSDVNGKTYFEALPENLKNFKKCTNESILGRWEVRKSSSNANIYTRLEYKQNGDLLFGSIEKAEGKEITEVDKDIVDTTMKFAPPEKYTFNDGMIYVTEGETGKSIPAVCIIAEENTTFNNTSVNVGELVEVYIINNKIVFFEILRGI